MTAFSPAKKKNCKSEFKILACAVLIALAAMFIPASPGPRAQSKAQGDEKKDAAVAGNKDNGKKLYRNDGCYECHGTEGQGAAEVTGPRIGPPQISFEGFSAYLRHPTGQMPPFTEKVVSEQELTDLYAYLQSRPKATPAKDIPLLNQ